MMRISNIKIFEDLSDSDIIQKVLIKYKIKKENIIDAQIVKKSIDARNKSNVHYLYAIDLLLENEEQYIKLESKDIRFYVKPVLPKIKVNKDFKNSPVIIGAGPSRTFCRTYSCRTWN